MASRHAETVTETARAFIARHFGETGRAWLAELPAVIEDLARRWRLEVGPPLHGGLMSAVHIVTRADGSSAVLKVGGPWSPRLDEALALRTWDGGPTPALLESDTESGALLLERVEPGTAIGDAAPADVARLLRSLHVRPPLDRLPTLGELVHDRLVSARPTGRTDDKLAWAFAKVAELEQGAPTPVLLHGDLDERNLLHCKQRGVAAIDPWPCLGDPAYDAGHWVHGNRRPGRRARLDAIAAATGLPRERVRDWAAVVGVHG